MESACLENCPEHEAELEPRHVVRKVRRNWLTRRPDPNAFFVATLSVLLLAIAGFFYWGNIAGAGAWMTAIPEKVFSSGEWWRPWTALLAHGDLGHFLSNSILFFAFVYLLYGQFGAWAFPGAALALGGITNIVVLTTLPSSAELLGISGVVYWMGGAWLALYFMIETRDKWHQRALKAMGVGVVLFIPETIRPNISYLSHFVGFVLGGIWGFLYFFRHRAKFVGAEEVEWIIEEPVPFDYD